MAYVPPALRQKQEAPARGKKGSDAQPNGKRYEQRADSNILSISDIQNHFWPTREVNHNFQEDNQILEQYDAVSSSNNLQEIQDEDLQDSQHNHMKKDDVGQELTFNRSPRVPGARAHSTLNGTESEPNKLKYVLLFLDAHPRWNIEQIIYVKSDLYLLPSPSAEPISSLGPQGDTPLSKGIQVFDQTPSFRSRSQHNARFTFLGYYSLTNLQLLEPNSPELVRMLEQKWTRTTKHGQSRQIQRDAASWKKSLGYQWAVLKFEKDEEMTRQLGTPNIPVSHGEEGESGRGKETTPAQPRRSVNEMLRDLRLKDEKKTDKHDIAFGNEKP